MTKKSKPVVDFDCEVFWRQLEDLGIEMPDFSPRLEDVCQTIVFCVGGEHGEDEATIDEEAAHELTCFRILKHIQDKGFKLEEHRDKGFKFTITKGKKKIVTDNCEERLEAVVELLDLLTESKQVKKKGHVGDFDFDELSIRQQQSFLEDMESSGFCVEEDNLEGVEHYEYWNESIYQFVPQGDGTVLQGETV